MVNELRGKMALGRGCLAVRTDVSVAAQVSRVVDEVRLALGSPTNMGLLAWKMKQFWDGPMAPHGMKVDGKIGCAFSSSGG